MNVNIKKIHFELYYHPPWPKDKLTFIRLLNQSEFTEDDIITLAQLYVKYSHIHYFQVSELKYYFKYMLKKMEISNEKQLFKKTNKIYQKKVNKS